jgi:hypothetical protein
MAPAYPLIGAREPSEKAIPASVLERCEAAIDALPCPAFTPHDADPSSYLSAREDCWNANCKQWPSVIVTPTTVAEVQAVVKAAAGKKVAVLSGGHSPMCMPNGAFLISLRKMNKVTVDPAAMVVTAEGGAKIGEVDTVLKPHHFAVPLGTHPDTGIGGLTLGGGIGWLTRRVGMAIDNLVSAEVVLADGTLVTASATSSPDLYWALRGGGGNFGVVVSFTYKVYAIGGAEGFDKGVVMGGAVPFAPDAYDRATVIEKFGTDTIKSDVDNCSMLLLALGGPCLWVFTHHGSETAAKAALDEIGQGYSAAGAPPKGGVGPIAWTDGVQTLTAMGEPNGSGDLLAPGNPFYYTAGFVEQLTPALAAFLSKAQTEAPDKTGIHAAGAIVIMPLCGHYNTVKPDATAVSARTANFWVVFLLRLEGDETQMAEGIAWGRSLKKEFMSIEGVLGTDTRLNPPTEMTGFPGGEESSHSVLPSQNAGCMDKMREVKQTYDPTNLFCYASLSK